MHAEKELRWRVCRIFSRASQVAGTFPIHPRPAWIRRTRSRLHHFRQTPHRPLCTKPRAKLPQRKRRLRPLRLKRHRFLLRTFDPFCHPPPPSNTETWPQPRRQQIPPSKPIPSHRLRPHPQRPSSLSEFLQVMNRLPFLPPLPLNWKSRRRSSPLRWRNPRCHLTPRPRPRRLGLPSFPQQPC